MGTSENVLIMESIARARQELSEGDAFGHTSCACLNCYTVVQERNRNASKMAWARMGFGYWTA